MHGDKLSEWPSQPEKNAGGEQAIEEKGTVNTACDDVACREGRSAKHPNSEVSGGVGEPGRPSAACPDEAPEGSAAGGKPNDAVAPKGEAREWDGVDAAMVAESIECEAVAADTDRSTAPLDR